jgi:hypothetical protein
VRDPCGLKAEVGDHGVDCATWGSSSRSGQSSRRCLLRGGDVVPLRGVEERSASATRRASASAVVCSCSQARAATCTHSWAAATSVLAAARVATRALSATVTVVGRGDVPWRKVVAEKGVSVGGVPSLQNGECRQRGGPTAWEERDIGAHRRSEQQGTTRAHGHNSITGGGRGGGGRAARACTHVTSPCTGKGGGHGNRGGLRMAVPVLAPRTQIPCLENNSSIYSSNPRRVRI